VDSLPAKALLAKSSIAMAQGWRTFLRRIGPSGDALLDRLIDSVNVLNEEPGGGLSGVWL
jgi:hypothetical protein